MAVGVSIVTPSEVEGSGWELEARIVCIWVAAARPKALPMADGQTIGKLVLATATQSLMTCYEEPVRDRYHSCESEGPFTEFVDSYTF